MQENRNIVMQIISMRYNAINLPFHTHVSDIQTASFFKVWHIPQYLYHSNMWQSCRREKRLEFKEHEINWEKYMDGKRRQYLIKEIGQYNLGTILFCFFVCDTKFTFGKCKKTLLICAHPRKTACTQTFLKLAQEKH